MTIEEFRNRLNNGPSAEELKESFENRITELVNLVIDDRKDLNELKNKIEILEGTIDRLQLNMVIDDRENLKELKNKIETLEGTINYLMMELDSKNEE